MTSTPLEPDSRTESAARSPFPWWVVVGGFVLALGYLPTLNTPFDFVDDGNLVYPAAAGTSPGGYVERWWDRVRANVDHLGPFRPVLWAHWELTANAFAGDPLPWRAARLGWCGLAAGMLLWLLRELKAHPTAALVAAAAAMWNPYRNEIWTSLTLAEGVAMPYALLALVAARKAGTGSRAWAWDLVAVLGLVAALGCKNVFVALVPAMLALRLWPDGVGLADGWRRNRGRAALYLLPLLLPAAHFAYFKLNWHPGQYETPGPSLGQAGRMGLWLKGAAGLDFLGAGLAVVAAALLLARRGSLPACRPRVGQGTPGRPGRRRAADGRRGGRLPAAADDGRPVHDAGRVGARPGPRGRADGVRRPPAGVAEADGVGRPRGRAGRPDGGQRRPPGEVRGPGPDALGGRPPRRADGPAGRPGGWLSGETGAGAPERRGGHPLPLAPPPPRPAGHPGGAV
jgi:hypothetical protein